MLEVEMKFPIADFKTLERRLSEWGATQVTRRREADQYFNAPDRDFASTDEALRLRRIGDANYVTYKGPKRDLQTKTRTEVEVPLAPGEAAAEGFSQILRHLGYRPVTVVRKERRVYRLERDGFPLEICLDDVEGLGAFAELEIMAPEEQLESARKVVLNTAAALGLAGSERRSYLQMLLQTRVEKAP
jgi:adenylate cyclase class 2